MGGGILEKKRLCFLVSFFVIVFWIWGLVTPTLSETLKCKSELLDEKIREEQQFDYTYSVGVNLKEGMAICENGETAEVKSFNLWNVDYSSFQPLFSSNRILKRLILLHQRYTSGQILFSVETSPSFV